MDSRLRGNDGSEDGNDGSEDGNDGSEAGNSGGKTRGGILQAVTEYYPTGCSIVGFLFQSNQSSTGDSISSAVFRG